MRLTLLVIFLLAFFFRQQPLFSQSDRGTITGTISDSTGAVVAAAAIEAPEY